MKVKKGAPNRNPLAGWVSGILVIWMNVKKGAPNGRKAWWLGPLAGWVCGILVIWILLPPALKDADRRWFFEDLWPEYIVAPIVLTVFWTVIGLPVSLLNKLDQIRAKTKT